MAKRTITIQYDDQGTFAYTDENGHDARVLHAKAKDSIHWESEHAFKITFKYPRSPFETKRRIRTYRSSRRHDDKYPLAKHIVAKPKVKRYLYTVTITDVKPNAEDDPEIQIDDTGMNWCQS